MNTAHREGVYRGGPELIIAQRGASHAEDLARRAASEFTRVCWTRKTLAAEILYYLPSVERRGTYAPYSMHAKCIVVDGGMALVGSANFSNRGRDRNLEVGTLIRDHHFVQSLLAAWDDVVDELAAVPV